MVKASPVEFLSLPVNGEPYITRNNVAVQQAWCENFTINDILDQDGEFKNLKITPQGGGQFSMKALLSKML